MAATPLHRALLAALGLPDPDAAPLGGGALFFRELADRAGRALVDAGESAPDDSAVLAALWDLVWAGLLSNDTLAPLRARLGGRSGAGVARTGRAGRSRVAATPNCGPADPALPSRGGPPSAAGRWALAVGPGARPDPAGARPSRGAVGAARRADQGRTRHRADHWRVRGRVPGAAGDGGLRSGSSRLRGGRARCGAVRGAGGDRPAARDVPAGRSTDRWNDPPAAGDPPASRRFRRCPLARASRARPACPGSCWRPPTRHSPTVRRWAGRPPSATPSIAPAARPVPWSCWWRARRCCTWSAAGGRSCRSAPTGPSSTAAAQALAGAVHEGWLGSAGRGAGRRGRLAGFGAGRRAHRGRLPGDAEGTAIAGLNARTAVTQRLKRRHADPDRPSDRVEHVFYHHDVRLHRPKGST